MIKVASIPAGTLSVLQVANELGVCEATIRRKIKQGIIQARKFQGIWIVPRDELKKWERVG